MTLKDIGMIAVSNNRSKAYLQRMLHSDLTPSHVLILENPDETVLPGQTKKDLKLTSDVAKSTRSKDKEFILDPDEALKTTLTLGEISHSVLKTIDINSNEVLSFIKSRDESIWIYSGAGGAILKKRILNCGKQFLHIHPGLVPEYKGSTTIYYSLLNEGTCGASAIFLSPIVDEGDIIARRTFAPPVDRRDIDYLFDPLIRSELLVEVLLEYNKKGQFETRDQPKGEGHYFIIHPILKHICIGID
ncbi:MAG: hypothetical protein R3A13_01310 [Bdellovibrionota bacterium]